MLYPTNTNVTEFLYIVNRQTQLLIDTDLTLYTELIKQSFIHSEHSVHGIYVTYYQHAQACKQSVLQKTKLHSGAAWREKIRAETRHQTKYGHGSGDSSCSAIALNRVCTYACCFNV